MNTTLSFTTLNLLQLYFFINSTWDGEDEFLREAFDMTNSVHHSPEVFDEDTVRLVFSVDQTVANTTTCTLCGDGGGITIHENNVRLASDGCGNSLCRVCIMGVIQGSRNCITHDIETWNSDGKDSLPCPFCRRDMRVVASDTRAEYMVRYRNNPRTLQISASIEQHRQKFRELDEGYEIFCENTTTRDPNSCVEYLSKITSDLDQLRILLLTSLIDMAKWSKQALSKRGVVVDQSVNFRWDYKEAKFVYLEGKLRVENTSYTIEKAENLLDELLGSVETEQRKLQTKRNRIVSHIKKTQNFTITESRKKRKTSDNATKCEESTNTKRRRRNSVSDETYPA